jgi:hypothetical protein
VRPFYAHVSANHISQVVPGQKDQSSRSTRQLYLEPLRAPGLEQNGLLRAPTGTAKLSARAPIKNKHKVQRVSVIDQIFRKQGTGGRKNLEKRLLVVI